MPFGDWSINNFTLKTQKIYIGWQCNSRRCVMCTFLWNRELFLWNHNEARFLLTRISAAHKPQNEILLHGTLSHTVPTTLCWCDVSGGQPDVGFAIHACLVRSAWRVAEEYTHGRISCLSHSSSSTRVFPLRWEETHRRVLLVHNYVAPDHTWLFQTFETWFICYSSTTLLLKDFQFFRFSSMLWHDVYGTVTTFQTHCMKCVSEQVRFLEMSSLRKAKPYHDKPNRTQIKGFPMTSSCSKTASSRRLQCGIVNLPSGREEEQSSDQRSSQRLTTSAERGGYQSAMDNACGQHETTWVQLDGNMFELYVTASLLRLVLVAHAESSQCRPAL